MNKSSVKAVSNGDSSLNTIVGAGTVFEGTMKAENGARIDGGFKGELFCSGLLTISQSSEVDAQIEGMEVYINGFVRGTVCAERVTLDSEARLIGDLYTGTLSISEGAVFHGKSMPLEERARNEQNGQAPESHLVSS